MCRSSDEDELQRSSLRDDIDWLDAEEQALWQLLVTAIRSVEAAMDKCIRRELGLDASCYTVLIALSEEADGKASSHQISERLAWPIENIRPIAEKLESLNLVTFKSGVDADNFAVGITAAGIEALRKGAPIYVEGVREIALGRLDDTVIKQLERLLPEMIRASKRMICEGDRREDNR